MITARSVTTATVTATGMGNAGIVTIAPDLAMMIMVNVASTAEILMGILMSSECCTTTVTTDTAVKYPTCVMVPTVATVKRDTAVTAAARRMMLDIVITPHPHGVAVAGIIIHRADRAVMIVALVMLHSQPLIVVTADAIGTATLIIMEIDESDGIGIAIMDTTGTARDPVGVILIGVMMKAVTLDATMMKNVMTAAPTGERIGIIMITLVETIVVTMRNTAGATGALERLAPDTDRPPLLHPVIDGTLLRRPAAVPSTGIAHRHAVTPDVRRYLSRHLASQALKLL